MSWAERAQAFIRKVHAVRPNATRDELIRALRQRRSDFTGGTSWGAKIWPREVNRYLAVAFPDEWQSKPAITARAKLAGRDDLFFPFAGESDEK